jgi:hypothetical protein
VLYESYKLLLAKNQDYMTVMKKKYTFSPNLTLSLNSIDSPEYDSIYYNAIKKNHKRKGSNDSSNCSSSPISENIIENGKLICGSRNNEELTSGSRNEQLKEDSLCSFPLATSDRLFEEAKLRKERKLLRIEDDIKIIKNQSIPDLYLTRNKNDKILRNLKYDETSVSEECQDENNVVSRLFNVDAKRRLSRRRDIELITHQLSTNSTSNEITLRSDNKTKVTLSGKKLYELLCNFSRNLSVTNFDETVLNNIGEEYPFCFFFCFIFIFFFYIIRYTQPR